MSRKSSISPFLVLRVAVLLAVLLGAVVTGMALINWISPALAIWISGAFMGAFLTVILFIEKVMPLWEQQITQEVTARFKLKGP